MKRYKHPLSKNWDIAFDLRPDHWGLGLVQLHCPSGYVFIVMFGPLEFNYYKPIEPKDGLVPVKMRIKPETRDQINRIHERMGTATKTDAVVKSVKLAELLLDELDAAGIILLQRPNGEQLELVLTEERIAK